jgi:putative phosphoesterase
MATRIGLISDVHASPQPLREALDIFQRERVDVIICLGDIAGYFDGLKPCIELLQQHRCKTIIGNHDEKFLQSDGGDDHSSERKSLGALPRFLTLELEGICLYAVHAQPPDGTHGGIKLLDQNGDVIAARKRDWTDKLNNFACDVLLVGHTHQVFAERLGEVLVINPGSVPFNHSCMILSLPDCSVQTFALSQKPVIKSWNFGRLFQGDEPYPVL